MAQFNLADYETVESRLKRYAKEYPDFRVRTRVIKYGQTNILIEAYIYQNKDDQEKDLYHASGIAEEIRGEGFVNKTSHVENCETSAIGRALANANFSGDKRPSREEMTKVERLSTPKTASDTKMVHCEEHDIDVPILKSAAGNYYARCPKNHFVKLEQEDKMPGDEYYDKEVREEPNF
jgi:hypothetical protein